MQAMKERQNPTKWSDRVMRKSHALELEEGIFTWRDPEKIDRSLRASAEASTSRNSSPLRSAMSMPVFYMNRAGTRLDDSQRAILEQAKGELRRLYGR